MYVHWQILKVFWKVANASVSNVEFQAQFQFQAQQISQPVIRLQLPQCSPQSKRHFEGDKDHHCTDCKKQRKCSMFHFLQQFQSIVYIQIFNQCILIKNQWRKFNIDKALLKQELV
ncbi:UNKNOWN [Stylonychia lemnae]|uniref:Uncharacterized protein n=1 Tax=Stylonychia lemnae TaxID=5949 RepID=A0A078AJC4_STYLE|nr:UNKNOWN [Stylonychia lemnae]|eukprot:CDW82425.1 UNKNOWN [Stylonychia lemnae]